MLKAPKMHLKYTQYIQGMAATLALHHIWHQTPFPFILPRAMSSTTIAWPIQAVYEPRKPLPTYFNPPKKTLAPLCKFVHNASWANRQQAHRHQTSKNRPEQAPSSKKENHSATWNRRSFQLCFFPKYGCNSASFHQNF